MNSMKQVTQQTEHELSGLLRYWRQQRGKSQLDRSLDTGVSQRHIGFVESGRSVPSRELLLSLAKTLDVLFVNRMSFCLRQDTLRFTSKVPGTLRK